MNEFIPYRLRAHDIAYLKFTLRLGLAFQVETTVAEAGQEPFDFGTKPDVLVPIKRLRIIREQPSLLAQLRAKLATY